MGNFYTNITLKGPQQEGVIKYLRRSRRTAYISPSVNALIVVYDQECEMQDDSILGKLARKLSVHGSLFRK